MIQVGGIWSAWTNIKDHFRDELVTATAEMIKMRWCPSPAPRWVTCIPSKKRPKLVHDFANRLAHKLGLVFKPVVVKVRDNQPQNLQENRFHQCRNLDGIFEIQGPIPRGPVLLVDDVVDSGWTLTVVSALLRRSGSSVVYPFALTTSASGA